MTLEKLLGGSADYLESLSDKELKEFFAPYLLTTRPSPEQEKLRKIKDSATSAPKSNRKTEAEEKMRRLWKEKFGTDME
jgi:hypothetical protein